MITGIAVTEVTHEVLEACHFPNPGQMKYLTPAFAVAFSVGLGATMLSSRLREEHRRALERSCAHDNAPQL